jgi:hypothetical protein
MEYLGLAVKKLLFECGIEVFQSKIGIVGKGKFANTIKESLSKDEAVIFEIENFSKKEKNAISDFDALIIADYHTETNYIGNNALIEPEELKKINTDIKIIHICGKVCEHDLLINELEYYPKIIAPLKHMSITTDFVGPKPLIDLHTAGLKVGEELSRARLKGVNAGDSISFALKNPLCQDFSLEQKQRYYN